MGLGRTHSVALVGIEGTLVEIEADVASGLPAFTITGSVDASLSEARERVRAAISNSALPFSMRRLTVNLSPAGLPKGGTGFDLAIAVAVLAAYDELPTARVRRVVHLGELGLDGRVRPVRGVLPAVLAAVRDGCPEVVVAAANFDEARLVTGADVIGVRTLAELVARYRGQDVPAGLELGPDGEESLVTGAGDALATWPGPELDLADVAGQDEARRAVEVAAAGGHNLFLVGPPGAGKTMLAARLPGLLPDLDERMALQVTAIHSLSGRLGPRPGLLTRPPFVDPHHSASLAAIVGGGAGVPRPGAISLAHGGVLFLDEAPEFGRATLDALRQPLESGVLTLHRARAAASYPARFQLVLAANPCPCGRSGSPLNARECTCSPMSRRRYLARLSGPLLDRVDLQIQVQPVTRVAMSRLGTAESTQVVAERVARARAAQRVRLADTPWVRNADVPGTALGQGPLALAPAVTQDLDRAIDRGTLSVRGVHRAIRVAWTFADLAGQDRPSRDDVARAVELRHQARAVA